MKWAKRLKLKQLRLLLVLAETGNLSETARKANMTQPALSRWLKELEDDVGHELFERHAKGVSPTHAGSVLLMHAQRILTAAERTQQDLDDMRIGFSRTLVIGMSPAAAPRFVPETVLRFLANKAHVYVEIQEGTMDFLLERLKLGKLDLLVGRLDNYKPDANMKSELLYRDPICIVARQEHPLANKKHLDWQDLEDYEWVIWPSGTPIRSRLDNALTAAGKRPPVYRIKSTSQVANLWLLQNSNMLSVASKSVAEHFIERGLLTELNLPLGIVAGAVGMIWRGEDKNDELLMELIDYFKKITINTTEHHIDEIL